MIDGTRTPEYIARFIRSGMSVISEKQYVAEIIRQIMHVAESVGYIIAPYDQPATFRGTSFELDCTIRVGCVAKVEFPFRHRLGTVVAGFRVCSY